MKDLGAGSFGTCKLAIDTDGEYVAVKLIPRGRRVRFIRSFPDFVSYTPAQHAAHVALEAVWAVLGAASFPS